MPHLAINFERLVPKCARRFWTNAHEFDEAEYKLNDRSCLTYISLDMQTDFLTWSCERYYRTDRVSHLHPHTLRRTCKRNFLQNHASTVTEQTEDLIFIRIHLVGPARGTSYRITPALLLNRQSISSSSTYIASDLQEELLTESRQHCYRTDGVSHLHPHTLRRTCKRNFSQNHASAVTEQTEDLIFIHIHLVGPARGTSYRITPAQLLNRRRISSSPISQQWTLRQLSRFYESWLGYCALIQLISSNKLPIFYTPSDLSWSQIAAISFSQLCFHSQDEKLPLSWLKGGLKTTFKPPLSHL